ncbi:MAG TPA: hypothetical protein PLN24_07710 [Victivallales bacterium]|nr:hypothetical protein [Victivallales bacterium]HPO90045.1 hypothetical protein [Victivallales bacterium]HRU02016.1 hypothetical protein [Victivallales bacterium]
MNSQNMTSGEKISEALKLLEEAAKEKKDDIKKLIEEKYHGLKGVLADTADNVAEIKKKAIEAAKKAGEITVEKSKEAAAIVDESVRKNPWYYIGGIAVSALLLGYILGRKSSEK